MMNHDVRTIVEKRREQSREAIILANKHLSLAKQYLNISLEYLEEENVGAALFQIKKADENIKLGINYFEIANDRKEYAIKLAKSFDENLKLDEIRTKEFKENCDKLERVRDKISQKAKAMEKGKSSEHSLSDISYELNY